MNQLLQNLLEGLRSASLASKATAALVAAALVATGVIAGVVSSRPHFELLYSGLSAQDAAAIQRALAEGSVRYEVSQPPGPFSIFVDQGERYGAQNLVAASGALERAPAGIPGGESGLSTVFMSAGERSQMVRKREWEETEGMLEELDFVAKAKVRTSSPSGSPFGKKEPVTASVTLHLLAGHVLDDEQAASVANLVRFGLGVGREDLVIADQHGRSVFDGNSDADEDPRLGDWIEFQDAHDRALEERVNGVLAETFGGGRARITVRSQWDFDRVLTQSEHTENSKALVSDERRTTKTPHGAVPPGTAGGAAGTASNVSQGNFGVDQAGVVGPGQSGVVSGEVFSETEDKRSEYVPSWVSTETRRTTPLLDRLSVSLFVDESLGDARAELEEVVKAAVGFDDSRGDRLSSMPTVKLEESPQSATEGPATTEGADSPADEPAAEEVGGNPLLDRLLETGVEVAAALAFVFLLFRSVRGGGAPQAGEPESTGGDAVDPELLARAKVDEMLIADPDKVGEILSEWAREEVRAG